MSDSSSIPWSGESDNQKSNIATETIGGIDVPRTTAEWIRHEHKRRGDAIEDLINDYIMLDPSMTITAQRR